MCIDRLKGYDSKLHFVITLTEERALAQAKAADAEIAAGKYRGPLHGIPWGAKDLLAVKGYPTTWGAGGFEHQSFDEDATVVKRLDEAAAPCSWRSSRLARLQWGTSGMAGGRAIHGIRTRFQRFVGRIGERCRGRMCRLRHWLGDARLYQFTVYALRRHWASPELWICAAHRSHGPELDDGQAWTDCAFG